MEQSNEKEVKEIILTLEGELMEEGSVDYKTLFDVIEGSVGAIQGFARISNFNQLVSYKVRPPRIGSFEITLQAVQWIGAATLPIIQNAGTIKDVVSFFIEYMKIKKALKGEQLKPENIQTNDNGDITIKNESGSVIYNDNRKITNVNIIIEASTDSAINKKIDRIAEALEKDKQIDQISFKDSDLNDDLFITSEEARHLKYQEKIEIKPDQLIGRIRMINDKNNKGLVTASVGDKELDIPFDIAITDIELLEKVVRNLAFAEGNRSRVLFTGEKTIDSKGKVKKIIVNDIDIPDQTLGF